MSQSSDTVIEQLRRDLTQALLDMAHVMAQRDTARQERDHWQALYHLAKKES